MSECELTLKQVVAIVRAHSLSTTTSEQQIRNWESFNLPRRHKSEPSKVASMFNYRETVAIEFLARLPVSNRAAVEFAVRAVRSAPDWIAAESARFHLAQRVAIDETTIGPVETWDDRPGEPIEDLRGTFSSLIVIAAGAMLRDLADRRRRVLNAITGEKLPRVWEPDRRSRSVSGPRQAHKKMRA